MVSENIVIYDWLSFTCKTDDIYFIIDVLGLSDVTWQQIKGARGYRDRLYFSSISIHYNGREDMGVWVEMSGQGCRAFESLTDLPNKWEDLFYTIQDYKMNITRLDVACDDHMGLLDINEIVLDTHNKNFVSKSDYWEIIESSKGQSLQFGSYKSDILIRIYDKARERICPEGTHWIRCELQLRRERAAAFTRLTSTIGQSFCGVVINYLRFVYPDETDTNKWRWAIKDYWGDYLENASRIQLYKSPGLEYNLENLENFVIKQAGNAIDTYIKIKGMSALQDALAKRCVIPNPKYQRLINEYSKFNL